MDILTAKQIRIEDYLHSLGHTPVRRQGVNLWYRSPLRQEKEASFKVNTGINCWYDFGLGKGGNLLALAAELHPSSDISGLLRQIAERNPPCVRYSYLPGNRLRKNPLSATWRHFRLPHTPCLPICRNGVSVRKPPGGNAGKSVTSAGANGIMPSAFRTLPAVLSFVAATSKVVYPQNQFQ